MIDRQRAPGMETSYGNAGQISPGYSTPWAAPGIPFKAMKWLFQRHSPLSIRPDGTLFQLRWMAQMLANCTSSRYALNKERMLRLAEYSRDCMRELRADTGIAYEARQQGILQVFVPQATRRDRQGDRRLDEAGVQYRASVEQFGEIEPVARSAASSPAASTIARRRNRRHRRLFTDRAAALAAQAGVRFRRTTRSIDRI